MANMIENNPVQRAMTSPATMQTPQAMQRSAPVAAAPPMLHAPAPLGNVQQPQQRVLSHDDLEQRAAYRAQQGQSNQQLGVNVGGMMAGAGMGQGQGYGQPQQQGYGQPQNSAQMQQQWQQFQQYMQQMQQQGGQQGYGQPQGYQGQAQQRMQQYGYGQPQGQRQYVQPQQPQQPAYAAAPYAQPQAASAGQQPGSQSMANMVERNPGPVQAPQQLRAAPMMNAAQPAMNVQSPQVAPAQTALAQSRPVAAAPQLANNPVHQAMGHPELSMSDATQKVIENRTLADDFLDHMKAYTYKYKDPGMEPRISPTGGTYLGVMAQDLERIPHLGQQIVVDTPHGKMVDQKTALSATMAGVARLNERLRAVEQDALKKKGKK